MATTECSHAGRGEASSAHGDVDAVGLDRRNDLTCSRTDERERSDGDAEASHDPKGRAGEWQFFS